MARSLMNRGPNGKIHLTKIKERCRIFIKRFIHYIKDDDLHLIREILPHQEENARILCQLQPKMNTYSELRDPGKDSSLQPGRSLSIDEHLVPGEDILSINGGTSQDSTHIRPKRTGDQGFLRIGRSPFLRIGRSPFLRIGRSPFLRIGRSPFLRIGRSPFLRIGRSQYQRTSRSPFLRIGRSPFIRLFHSPKNMFDKRADAQIILPDQYPEEDSEYKRSFLRIGRASKGGFLRIGRSNNNKKPSFLRFGRADKRAFLRIGRPDESFLRIGRSNEMTDEDAFEETGNQNIDETVLDDVTDASSSMDKREESNGLTTEELQLLMANKELLLQYMEAHPELFDGSQNEDDDAYFAFPRQGRAMSFYFPRMGRSGEDSADSTYCCAEGVRKVFTVGKGSIDICSNEKSCCSGLSEQTKVYKDIVITECAEESGLDKIRAYIGDE
ncbi:uncharacterized protein LOC132752033 isoform X3 [Ruditapes philippinarum]|uniref:uncharacterized protein LOC132752033 isoform X3 n=1 Tax=Ruditapes philippinarum TaxID=129788 RepID=UPI00295BD755|nr:uncharacterized protein LOC132752033 isoform X3 [Ruditapes philippinarum]